MGAFVGLPSDTMNAGEFAKRRARIEIANRGKGYAARAFDSLVRQAKAAIAIAGGKVVGWRLPNGQMVCKKRRYPGAEIAEGALADIHDCPRGKYVPVRVYECPYCKGWHLTHQNREHLS